MFINDAIALGTACHTLKWKSVELKTKVGAYFYHPNRKYCLRCLGVLCNKAVTFFFVCLFVFFHLLTISNLSSVCSILVW